MIIEKSDFIIEYNNENYINDLITKLEENKKILFAFFEIDKLKTKKKIKIWDNREDYRNYLEQYVNKYYDWMIADTYDGNINMLAIEECKKTKSHSDITFEDFLQNIVHEFVHSCQQEINPDATNVEWFWEALATNLGNPYDHVTSIQYSKEELMHSFASLSYNYNTAYTIGKYMLENYSHDIILEYVRNPSKLIDDMDNIIIETKTWFNKNYLELPEKPKIENDDFVVYSSDSLSKLSEDTLKELSKHKKRILDFFNISNYRKVQINLYDSQENFIKFLQNVRSPECLIPKYCKGTFDDYMINHSINQETLDYKYEQNIKSSIHEFVHIIYNDAVSKERVIWLDEGLAMNLSGDHDAYLDEEEFKEFFRDNLLSISNFPAMNDLTHGEKFVNEKYNGYDLSYISVRYMLETMSHEDVLEIIKDGNKAKVIGTNVLNDAIDYYSQKLDFITVHHNK